MNAIEQEYAEDIDRARAPIDRRDFAIISALCVALAVLHASSLETRDVAIFSLLAVATGLSAIRAQIACSTSSVKPSIAPLSLGYRDAIAPTTACSRHSPRNVFIAVRVVTVVTLGLVRDGIGPWGVVVVGAGIVIAIQRVHAASKKRHDAKLMVEWERRLEEMK